MNIILIKTKAEYSTVQISVAINTKAIIQALEASEFVLQYKVISSDHEEMIEPKSMCLDKRHFPKWCVKFDYEQT